MQSQDPSDNAAGINSGRTQKLWPGLVLALLGLVVLLQLTLLGRNTFREMPRLYADIGQPAAWRSAKYSQGGRFAQYIQFLNQKIPPDSRVVLPPDSAAPRAIATTPVMQFFLLPRRVINCTHPSCLESLSLENSAVLVTGGFPGADTLSQGRLEPFDAGWGVLLPAGAVAENQAPTSGYTRANQILRDALLAVAWLAVLTLGGFLIVQLLLPPSWDAARLALGYGLGLSILSLGMALVSLAGIPLRGETILAVTLLLPATAGAGLLVKRRLWPQPDQDGQRRKTGGKPLRLDPWQIAFVILAALAALLSVGKSYHATDELVLWGVKGYGIAADGTIQSVTQWGTNTVAYPLHIPLAIAAARLSLNEALPASKLLFPGYALALSLLLYQTLRQLGLRRTLAGLPTLAAISAPLVFRHGTLAYANLPLSFYLFAAVALLAHGLTCSQARPASGAMLLSGIFLAAAAWTRPEGLAFSWLMIGATLSAAYIFWRGQIGLRGVAFLIVPLLAYSALWLWLKAAVYPRPLGRGDLVATASEQILSGRLNLPQVVYIVRSLLAGLFDLETWGLLGITVLLVSLALLIVLGLRRLHWREVRAQPVAKDAFRAGLVMAVCGWAYLLAIAGMYYLTSYDTIHDISWWVSTGLDRMIMPGLLLAWAGGIVMVQDSIQPKNVPSPAA